MHESLQVQCIDVIVVNLQAKCTELVVIHVHMSTSSSSGVHALIVVIHARMSSSSSSGVCACTDCSDCCNNNGCFDGVNQYLRWSSGWN